MEGLFERGRGCVIWLYAVLYNSVYTACLYKHTVMEETEKMSDFAEESLKNIGAVVDFFEKRVIEIEIETQDVLDVNRITCKGGYPREELGRLVRCFYALNMKRFYLGNIGYLREKLEKVDRLIHLSKNIGNEFYGESMTESKPKVSPSAYNCMWRSFWVAVNNYEMLDCLKKAPNQNNRGDVEISLKIRESQNSYIEQDLVEFIEFMGSYHGVEERDNVSNQFLECNKEFWLYVDIETEALEQVVERNKMIERKVEELFIKNNNYEASYIPRSDRKYDVFISHASEDKEQFVKPLVVALEAAGYKVWYDEFTLKVGDSLRRSIDSGLSNSRYGVVVFSSAFFEKNWTQYELDGLVDPPKSG